MLRDFWDRDHFLATAVLLKKACYCGEITGTLSLRIELYCRSRCVDLLIETNAASALSNTASSQLSENNSEAIHPSLHLVSTKNKQTLAVVRVETSLEL